MVPPNLWGRPARQRCGVIARRAASSSSAASWHGPGRSSMLGLPGRRG